MPQDYIPRRSSSSSGSRRTSSTRESSSPSTVRRQSVRSAEPVRRTSSSRQPVRYSSRKKSGPPLFPLLLLVLVIAVAVVVIVLVSRSCSSSGETQTPDGSNSSAVSGAVTDPAGEASADPNAAATPAPTPSAEPTPAPQEEPQAAPETIGGLLIVEDTAYEYYNFVTDLANDYITAVANAGQKLSGKATVYDMVIPTSIDIMLPESYIEKNSLNTSDQKKAIDEYILPSIAAQNPEVKTISIFDTLKAHANEYLYFRTDHHWTQLGAYYGYEEFCKAKGVDPVPLSDFDRADYTGYLGSFYTSSNSAALAANPDTVEAYIPKANVNLSFTQSDGVQVDSWPLIADGEQYDSTSKYIVYCAGDQPYEEIVNNDMAEGPSIVVVKESFGNCFIPFLVNHYKNIYVVDYRYYDGTVSDLVDSTGATDVLLLNNVSMTRNEGLIDSFSNIF